MQRLKKRINTMKRTYKEVKEYKVWGNETIISDVSIVNMFKGNQPTGYNTGYFAPSQANWCYQFAIVKLNGKVYEVVTQFGAVVGGRLINLYENGK